MGGIIWKRTGLAVLLVAVVILLFLAFVGPLVWAARALWDAVRITEFIDKIRAHFR